MVGVDEGQRGDPRSRRTREALRGALLRLGRRREPLSVSALVAEAAVGRATFYTHYTSLDDLVIDVIDAEFLRIAREYAAVSAPNAAAMRRANAALVGFVADNRVLFDVLGSAGTSRDAQLVPVRHMAEVIRGVLVEHPDRPAELQADVTARYIAGAAWGLVDAVTSGELIVSTERLVDHLVAMLPPWFVGDEGKE